MKISFTCSYDKDKKDYVIEDPREWDGFVDKDMLYSERGLWYKLLGPIEQNRYRYYIDCGAIDTVSEDWLYLQGISLNKVMSIVIQMLRDKRINEILDEDTIYS